MQARLILRKRLGLEALFERRERQAHQVAAALADDRGVLGVRAQAFDRVDHQRKDLAAVAHQHPGQRLDLGLRRRGERRQGGVARRGVLQRVLHGLDEALLRERLQQVVDRMQLERLDRMLVVGGGEDHRRRRRGPDRRPGRAAPAARSSPACGCPSAPARGRARAAPAACRARRRGRRPARARAAGAPSRPGLRWRAARLRRSGSWFASSIVIRLSFAGRTISTQKPSPGAERTSKRARPP